MRATPLLLIVSSTLSAALVLTGCGGKKTATPATSASPTTSAATSTAATGTTTPSASALQAEANAAATGDIPDNQVFIRFRDAHAAYSMKYPEGWAQQGTGARVRSGPQPLTIAGARAFKVVYTTASAPNAVTGKRVTLQVDRYYLSHAGKEAIVDLGTPVGVDNVDAYRLMIESYRWR